MHDSLKTVTYTTVLTYINLFFGFLFTTLFIQVEQGSLYALYAEGLSLFSILFTFISFGHQRSLVIPELSVEEFRPTTTLAFLYWFICIAVVFGVYLFFLPQKNTGITFSLLLLSAQSVLLTTLLPLWQWEHKITEYNVWLLGATLLKVLLMSFSVLFNANAKSSFLIMAFSSMLYFFLMCASSNLLKIQCLLGKKRFQQAFASLKSHTFKLGFPFWLSLIAVSIYVKVDILLLSKFGIPKEDFALYAYIYAILSAIFLLPVTVYNSLLKPLLSGRIKGNKVWILGNGYMLLLGGSAGVAFFFLLPMLINFLVTDSALIVPTVKALAPAIPFAFMGSFLNLALITTGKTKVVAFSQLIAAFLNVLLNIFLIPVMGVVGSAWATSITYLLLFSLFFLFCTLNNTWEIKGQLKIFLGVFIAFLFLFVSPLFLCLLLFISVYLILTARGRIALSIETTR